MIKFIGCSVRFKPVSSDSGRLDLKVSNIVIGAKGFAEKVGSYLKVCSDDISKSLESFFFISSIFYLIVFLISSSRFQPEFKIFQIAFVIGYSSLIGFYNFKESSFKSMF